MKINSLRARLHRYKRNLIIPCLAFAFVASNFVGCTRELPIGEDNQEISGSVDGWNQTDSTHTTKPDSVRDMTHADSVRFGLI